jgi:hypothetical protein
MEWFTPLVSATRCLPEFVTNAEMLVPSMNL